MRIIFIEFVILQSKLYIEETADIAMQLKNDLSVICTPN